MSVWESVWTGGDLGPRRVTGGAKFIRTKFMKHFKATQICYLELIELTTLPQFRYHRIKTGSRDHPKSHQRAPTPSSVWLDQIN